MPVSEIVSWVALALSLLLGILVIAQATRVARIEKQFRALTRGVRPGASAMSLGDLVAMQGAKLDGTRDEVEALRRSTVALENALAQSV